MGIWEAGSKEQEDRIAGVLYYSVYMGIDGRVASLQLFISVAARSKQINKCGNPNLDRMIIWCRS